MSEPPTTDAMRPIPGFDGYLASDSGLIFSLWKMHGNGHGKKAEKRIGTVPRPLKPEPRKEDGRLRHTLRSSEGKLVRRYRSHFVLLAFVGPCPDGMEACHNNGKCTDDAAENLRWDTPQSNVADKIAHGAQPRGSAINTSRLTESQVLEIRSRPTDKLRVLAAEYGVTEQAIYAVRHRKVWKHV